MSEPTTKIILPEQLPPLSDRAVGAVVALLRVVELYDPAVAHRAALRAIIASQVVEHLETAIAPSVFIATAALADVDQTITRPTDPEATREPTRALLAKTAIERLPGLKDVAVALEAQNAWWDGKGTPSGLAGDDIPLPSRVLLAADALIANPASGFLPSWEHGRQRVATAAGVAVDPDIARVIIDLPLENIESPPNPSAVVGELLDRFQTRAAHAANDEASTITSAIASAGDARDVLALFARTAQSAVDAQVVDILASTGVGFSSEAQARATRGDVAVETTHSALDFTVESELRAGVSLETSSAGDDHIDTLMAPIFANEQCWGVLIARRSPSEPPFTSSDLSALRHIASETGPALASTSHWAEMQRMALCDQLTGLANRHELYRVLDAIFERPTTDRLDTALIMCDVDGLKIINDTLGHQEGDRLLMDAALALRGASRDSERTTVCRIGGDEFCMVIDGGALLTAYEISDTIERLFARSGGSDQVRSISCGIAFANEDITSRSALLRAADENQYETKRSRKQARSAQSDQADGTERQAVDRRAIRD